MEDINIILVQCREVHMTVEGRLRGAELTWGWREGFLAVVIHLRGVPEGGCAGAGQVRSADTAHARLQ